MKKAPKVISYALWGIVLFRLLCPAAIGSSFSISGPDGLQNLIDVSKWEWQEFPYTDEEWAAFYVPQGFHGMISNISKRYHEMLYQPLIPDQFLLKMDGSLWLVELRTNEQMGTYLWSIYSLVPESAMGMVP